MTTVYRSEEGVSAYPERVEVTSVLHLDGVAPEGAAGTTNDFVVAAGKLAQDSGPLRVDAAYDEALRRLSLSVRGSLRGVVFMLESKSASGEGLVGGRSEISTLARVDGIDRTFANSIATYLMNSAQGHPQDDLPLRFETPYDERQSRLELRVTGSAFATSYLLIIVAMRLEQARRRA